MRQSYMHRIYTSMIAALICILAPGAAHAGDEPEHRQMVYVLALRAGFQPQEAKVISDGSWSMDTNNATTALRGGLAGEAADAAQSAKFLINCRNDIGYGNRLLTSNAALDHAIFSPKGELSRIGPAAFYHSLMTDPQQPGGGPGRPSLDNAFGQYLHQEVERRGAGGDTKTVELLMVGTHTHQLVDSNVHPQDPFYGHLAEGHQLDYAANDPPLYSRAAMQTLQALRAYHAEMTGGGKSAPAAGDEAFCTGLVGAIVDGYNSGRDHGKGRGPVNLDSTTKALIDSDVNAYASKALGEAVNVPEFTQAGYTAGGASFEVRYPGLAGGKANIRSFIQWVLANRPDLAESVRRTMRDHIRDWRHLPIPRAFASYDPAVGGVMIKFDTQAFEGRATEDDTRRVLNQVQSYLQHPTPGGILFCGRDTNLTLRLVSLRRLLESGASTLGSLTRVRGYILDGSGDLIVAGTAEPGGELIGLDLLTVALRAIWQKGDWPYISLDPSDIGDLTAPHRARIGGLETALEDTDFVDRMLKADYTMKRIDLGKERTGVPGFTSWIEMLRAGRGGRAAYKRSWLSPLVLPVADVYETARGDRSAVLFESRVQVLSEAMKDAGDYLAPAGASDPAVREAAASMTRYYDSIEQREPSFRRLHAVFDLCKLCAIWRARGVKSDLLNRIAARTPARVAVRRSYAGLSSDAGDYIVQGGATTQMRVTSRTVVSTDRLAPLLDEAGAGWRGAERQAPAVTLPAGIQVAPSRLADYNTELLYDAAVEDFGDGRFEAALARLNAALSLDPEMGQAYAYRALALFSLGRIKEALADGDRLVRFDSRLIGFRSLLKVYAGDRDGALEDSDDSLAAHPDDRAVLLWNTLTQVLCLDMARAEALLKRLAALSPLDRSVYDIQTEIDVLHRLGPDKAKDQIRSVLATSIPLAAAYSTAVERMSAGDAAGAADAARRCLALTGGSGPADMRERSELVLGLALGLQAQKQARAVFNEEAQVTLAEMQQRFQGGGIAAGMNRDELTRYMASGIELQRARAHVDLEKRSVGRQAAEAMQIADEMIERHPDWPSAYLAKALIGLLGGAASERAGELFDQAVSINASHAADPLTQDLAMLVGTDRVFPCAGLVMLFTMKEAKASDEQMERQISRVATVLGSDGALLKAIVDASAQPDKAERLALLQRAEASVPDKPASDCVAALGTALFYNVLLQEEEEAGQTDRFREHAVKFLRIAAAEYRSWEVMTIAAMYRLNVTLGLAESYARSGEVERALSEAGQFAAAWIPVIESAQNRGAPDGEKLEEVVNAAKTPLELRELSLFSEVLRAKLDAIRGASPPGAATIRRAIARLDARLKSAQRPAGIVAHDWTGWPAEPVHRHAAPITRFFQSAVRGRRGQIAAAIAVVAIAGAVVIVIRRIRRRKR